ncbi:hypothetical protein OTK49_00350 [Vibrio coralliirubri]|uniref:hypothetical protein n=1 Tax=Vibrio coralliirubri TaxID=1516159 RepID=UPI0022849335|nr:hypothetical protein [Vibrio coralliirubri]MCY9860991.1 hypothetical protein [Vibrio coralliirubri]
MELRSITGVDRVFKANLNQIDKAGVYSDHHSNPSKEKIGVEQDEVLHEIAKTLGKYPPIKEGVREAINLDSLRADLAEDKYQPDLDSLADRLIDLI